MSSSRNERLSGLFLAVIGAILTIWNWHSALLDGNFHLRIAFLGPVSIVTGLNLLVLPDRIGWRTLAVAIVSASLNLVALMQGWRL
jgi:uncharacterized protein YjeT (DUF2065 family)